MPPEPTPEEEAESSRRMQEYEAQRRLQRNLAKRRKHAKIQPGKQ